MGFDRVEARVNLPHATQCMVTSWHYKLGLSFHQWDTSKYDRRLSNSNSLPPFDVYNFLDISIDLISKLIFFYVNTTVLYFDEFLDCKL